MCFTKLFDGKIKKLFNNKKRARKISKGPEAPESGGTGGTGVANVDEGGAIAEIPCNGDNDVEEERGREGGEERGEEEDEDEDGGEGESEGEDEGDDTDSALGLKHVFSGNEPIVDIIAVHGLNGHPTRTWTWTPTKKDSGRKNTKKVFWLRDLLPVRIPNSRIYSYGYDARTHSSSAISQQFIHDHAKALISDLAGERRDTKTDQRPIVFVAHSLGGIIVKQALVHSDATRVGNLERHKSVTLSTFGILFLGTPHQGCHGVEIGELLLRMGSIFTRTNTRIMENLKKNSQMLDHLKDQFALISRDFENYYFYETRETKTTVGLRWIVPKDSAVPWGDVGSEQIGIQRDHIQMVKYRSLEDEGFKNVSRAISTMLEDAPKNIAARWENWEKVKAINLTKPHYFIVPPIRVPYFTGREDLLNLLHTKISAVRDDPEESLVIPVWGMGGVGKTQLILQYISVYRKTFDHTLWIDATDEERMIQDIMKIAIKVKLIELPKYNSGSDPGVRQKMIEAVRGWLEEPKGGPWLVIFDNADNKDILPIIQRLAPRSSRGNIILTSRLRDACDLAPSENAIEVAEMSEAEASILLLKRANHGQRAPGIEVTSESETSTLQTIVRALGFLPMALDLAGAYINRNCTTLDKYLFTWNDKSSQKNLSGHKPTLWNYSDTILTAWEISFQMVKQEDPRAAEMLLVMGYLYHEDISEELFRKASLGYEPGGALFGEEPKQEQIDALVFFNDILAKDSSGEWQSLQFTEAMGTLLSYSLLQTKTYGKHYSLHPLIHLWSYEYSQRNDQSWRYSLSFELIANALPAPNIDRENDYEFLREVSPHMDQLRHDSKWEILVVTLDTGIFDRFEAAYLLLGRSKEAIDLGEQLLAARKRLLGEEDFHTLSIMNCLATAYTRQGQLEKAEALGEQALVRNKKLLGEEHPSTLRSMITMATTYREQARWGDSRALGEQVVATRKRLLGEEHPGTLRSISYLVATYEKEGHWKEAGVMGEQVVAAMKRVFGEEHPDTLLSIRNLIATYQRQGHWKEAGVLQEQVLATMKRVFGEEHPNTLGSMGLLSTIYRQLGRWKEAEVLGEQVLDSKRRVFGEENHYTLSAMGNLGYIYLEQGRWKEAEVLIEQVLAGQKRVLGEEHRTTLGWMVNLAVTYQEQNRWNEAGFLVEQLVAKQKRLMGEEHPETLASMVNLSLIYREQHRLAESVALGEQVLATQKRLLGEEHPNTLALMSNLGMTYGKQGLWKEAEALLEKVVTIKRSSLGEEHPSTLLSMSNVTVIYRNQGRLKEAEVLGEKVLASKRRLLGNEHPATLGSMIVLANIYEQQGHWEGAVTLGEEAVSTHKKLHGDTHILTLNAMSNLSQYYLSNNRLKDAEDLAGRVVELKRTTLGDNNPDTLESMYALAKIYKAQHRLPEAESLQHKVISELVKSQMSEDHPDMLRSAANLAEIYSSQNRWGEAENLGKQVLASRKRALGDTHPDTLESMDHLARTFFAQGRSKEAEELGAEVLLLRERLLGEAHPHTLESNKNLEMYRTQRQPELVPHTPTEASELLNETPS